jgi:hypothetical protein
MGPGRIHNQQAVGAPKRRLAAKDVLEHYRPRSTFILADKDNSRSAD